MLLYACTIFTSAFLLFLVQPIIAKQVLPWFGGSAAVWTTCLVFFQVALLAGYAYSDLTTRRLAPRTQVIVHVCLLLLSLAALPIVAAANWKPAGSEDPGIRILGLLVATIGLPYFLLATTGPLVQAWFARAFPRGTVYRLYALSNVGSLLALVSYPFAMEPRISTAAQANYWSIAYAVFALLCAATALYSLRRTAALGLAASAEEVASTPALPPGRLDMVLWLVLPALGSWLLLAITNHITQNIASIPFLWLAPLTLYLLSFILCFDSDRWYRRALFLPLTAAAVGLCAWGLQDSDLTLNIHLAVPLYLSGLFACCMFFHGELAKLRPPPRQLTSYYLMISLGGALGGLFVGVIAPHVFNAYYEIGLGFVLTAIVAAITLRRLPLLVWIWALVLAGLSGYYWNEQIKDLKEDTRVMVRNFYGMLRTKDTGTADTPDAVRRLIHGVILHGEQYLAPKRRTEPTTYYGPDSGAGLALKYVHPQDQRVGVIGLGTGTLAAWGKPGDSYHFYEINPQVIALARSEFSYLKDSKAEIEISLGDARLSLEREAPHQFDVLAIDAFSSDSIPVHLMTREAMAVYLRHMSPTGVIAFHVTNRFLNLAPVVKQIADSYQLYTALITDDAEDTDYSRTDWVLVARDRAALESSAISKATHPITEIPGLKLWTDDYNNLFDILR